MENLTKLVEEYKTTKNETILIKIFSILNKQIIKKANYIYKKKRFQLRLFSKCKECTNCSHDKPLENKLAEISRKKICSDCLKCTCRKGYFNLKENCLCEYEDVEQDLKLLVLNIINNYDITRKNFESYFYSSIWNYRPLFITTHFVNSIENNGLEAITEENEPREERSILIDDIFDACKTKNERKICKLYLQNLHITEEELGKKLKMTKQGASKIIKKLRERLKKYLSH